ncbi:MAG: hypothetical protein LBB76_11335 [Azoarcus sp.]|nr:hypothetical protein [Azoarcus sp.]
MEAFAGHTPVLGRFAHGVLFADFLCHAWEEARCDLTNFEIPRVEGANLSIIVGERFLAATPAVRGLFHRSVLFQERCDFSARARVLLLARHPQGRHTGAEHAWVRLRRRSVCGQELEQAVNRSTPQVHLGKQAGEIRARELLFNLYRGVNLFDQALDTLAAVAG